jgi:hypothetical protein
VRFWSESFAQIAGGLNGPRITTVACAWLFAVFVSGDVVLTVATFVAVPGERASATTVIDREMPGPSVPSAQSTTAPPLHAGSFTETKVSWEGIGSTSTTAAAGPEPSFVTISVYVTCSPTLAEARSARFVTAMSTG